MNRSAFYTFNPAHANKVFGPFLDRAEVDAYAAQRGHDVAALTCNEIIRARIRVTAPYATRR